MRKDDLLDFDVLEVLKILPWGAFLYHVHYTKEIVLIVEKEVCFVQFCGVWFLFVGYECLGLRPRSSTGIELAIFDKLGQLWIVFFDVGRQGVELIAVDGQEGRHEDDLLHLAEVIPIVEELIQPVAGFLWFSNK